VTPTLERLERQFPIGEGVILPAGGAYDFRRYLVGLATANRRRLAVTSHYEWGRFFSGTRRELSIAATLRPRPGLAIGLDGEGNQVDLPEGRFSTRLLRGMLNVQPSPWMSFMNNIQYDSVSRSIGWQFRFRWIRRPGDDLYFVYTHNWQEDHPRAFQTLDRKGAVKIIRTFGF
jgi:hypothetical protein